MEMIFCRFRPMRTPQQIQAQQASTPVGSYRGSICWFLILLKVSNKNSAAVAGGDFQLENWKLQIEINGQNIFFQIWKWFAAKPQGRR